MEDFGLSAIIYLLIVLTTDNTLRNAKRILNLSDGGNIIFLETRRNVCLPPVTAGSKYAAHKKHENHTQEDKYQNAATDHDAAKGCAVEP